MKNIAERLANAHDISVFVPNPVRGLPSEEEINNVKIKRFRCLAPNDSYYLSLSLSLAARQYNADILHIHGYYDLTPPLTILLKNRHPRCLFTLHSSGSSSSMRTVLHLPYNLTMRKIMCRVDRVICVSRFELEYFRNILRLPKGKMELIPNGVNLIGPEKESCKKTLPATILSAGRLEKYKGHHRVIRAFGVFRQQFPEIEARLCILGTGPYKRELESEVKKLQLNDSVQFLDWLSSLQYAALLEQSSMLVLLSDYESQSIVVSEALSVRTPVIVANNSALAEYVNDGSAIGVQNPDDSYEVAGKMKTAFSDPQCCRFSNNNLVTWDEVTKKVSAVYYELLRR